MSDWRVISTLAALAIGGFIAPAAALEPEIAAGETVETRLDADLDGNGSADLAYVVTGAAWRELRVALAGRGAVEALDLSPDVLGTGTLSLAGDVLSFDDLTGGTTAYASTRRFRFDGLRNRMRVIGIDVKLYSRTFAHDGFALSWNLLNGDTTAHELTLNRSRGETAYDDSHERHFKRRTRPMWLEQTPDPETLLEETSQD